MRNKEKKILDEMFKLTSQRIEQEFWKNLFDPKDSLGLWCKICDGLHRTEDCKEIRNKE